jgi:hypothetical protein
MPHPLHSPREAAAVETLTTIGSILLAIAIGDCSVA